MKNSIADKCESLARLHEIVKPGATVYCILRRVSRSGVQREIGLVVFVDDRVLHLNYSVAKVLGDRLNKDQDGVVIRGCGMDMGFALVCRLAYALFGDECALKHQWL